MKKIIERKEALELLERAVAEKGADYTVDQCQYFENDSSVPVCIVGHVLCYLGVPTEEFNYRNTTKFSLVAPHLDSVQFTDEAVYALNKAQIAQDHGKTWGEALEVASRDAS